MIGNPFRHLAHHPHHLRRVLLVVLLALAAYLLLSDSAAAEPLPAECELSGLLTGDGGDCDEWPLRAQESEDPSVILP